MASEPKKNNGTSIDERQISDISEESSIRASQPCEPDKSDEAPITRDKQVDIEVEGDGQRRKLIIALTWPALAENLLSSFMSMVDMIMVGGLGAYALAAVGLIMQPKFIMLAAFMAMSVGTTAIVAQYKGARNPDGANNALNQSIILSIAMVSVICTIMLISAEPLIRMIAGSEIAEKSILEAITYYKIQIYGFPTVALTFTINAALRGAGNTRATFYNNTIANIVNVIFNYCLINGRFGFPRMEVAGASLATVIGQCVGFVMAVYVAARGKQYISLNFRKRWNIDFSMIKRILRIGIPSLVEQVIMRAGVLWFTTMVTALGDIAYAAHMVALNIQMLSFTTGMAFGTAATTLVGQSIGRQRIDLAKKYVRMTQELGIVVSVVIAGLMAIFGKFIAGWYTNETAIILLSADMLKIIAIANPIVNARAVYVSALRGAGDSKTPAFVTFIGMIIIRPLTALLLVNVFNMGLTGIWIALSSDFVIEFLVIMLRYRKGKWTTIKV